ncbi:hypothetical protein O1D97_05965 [Marinomonas sp. 15G1-11]|uniref:Uncharacterized protein n=1 Tax=Marinomonas phaeophyticola TaxID=3004091 RepID=A0ABT4JS46_9GAMM|nr:hypothetical protein [Marinomonas sp. 15G1-11]MCZ2721206.1 hypothetical protein [Marinomonas sp. 15G1-11]
MSVFKRASSVKNHVKDDDFPEESANLAKNKAQKYILWQADFCSQAVPSLLQGN